MAYTQGDASERYTYDAEGVRRSKTTGGITVIFISDTSGELSQTLAETDSVGNVTAVYTRADTLISQTRGDTTYVYMYDGHGDVRGLLSSNGKFTDRYRYNAYGELVSKKGDTENHYLYTGEYYDEASGLYYLRARYMNPETGTFISMDTYEGSIYDPDTLHKYLYANGNPVKYTDPTGNFFSAVESLVATTMNSIMSNYHTLNAMGIISGVSNSAVTVLLGGDNMDVMESFVKGYITGFALGSVVYVAAAYEIMTIAQMSFLLASSNTVMTTVLTIASVSSGHTKEAIVYGTLSILSLYTTCQMYNMQCSVNVIGDKGGACVEFDNSDPNHPTCNEKKIKVEQPHDIGVKGEDYVAQDLSLAHNNGKVIINGRNRIPDFYDKDGVIAESKNVDRQSYTLQLRDYVLESEKMGTKLILYVRKNTVLTAPLKQAISDGKIELRTFPW